tara:strand:- start:13151 stop:13810 length:660 start_codon:yes stop_codon:yes gene_type:complete
MYVNYAKNIYTYNGDDGIIAKLFEDLHITDGIVCEFGAWDGITFSGTAALWKDQDFKAVLIESDTGKYIQLLNNTVGRNTDCYNCGVSKDRGDYYSIDNILSRCKYDITSDNFALMIIDIDSYDYYVFESMDTYLPKVCVVEVSSGYQPHQDHISTDSGCSLKSITELAEKKGYKLVCHSGNAIFVREDLIDKIPEGDYSVENLWLSPEKLLEKERRLK